MNRERSSFLDDLMDIAAYLPWWAGALLAIASYLIIHYFAVMEIPHGEGPKGLGNAIGAGFIKIVAMFMQYLVPMALSFGALLSGVKQWKRKSILKKQTNLASIRELNWNQFELLIGQAFREKGYQVTETKEGPDGGVDLILLKADRKYLVQCKHWKKSKIGVKEVRELNGIVAARVAYGGILVTSGKFTREAVEFAEGSDIELIDGAALNRLIPHIEPEEQSTTAEQTTPDCPKCGSKMVKRTAKKGVNSGSHFWGCSTYPNCRGTRNLT